MDTYNKFSCFIIGEGTLPIQCAEILLDREHAIYGIISSDAAVLDWARERGISHIDPKNKDTVTFLSQHPFDYLFSIVNMSILPRNRYKSSSIKLSQKSLTFVEKHGNTLYRRLIDMLTGVGYPTMRRSKRDDSGDIRNNFNGQTESWRFGGRGCSNNCAE